MRPDTRAVHAGREDLGRLGVLDLFSTYPLGELADAVASLDALAAGGPPRGNPI